MEGITFTFITFIIFVIVFIIAMILLSIYVSRQDKKVIEMTEKLAKATGITYNQASSIISDSKVVNTMNFDDWLSDIKKIVKPDTIDD